jgi:hypothetical protein
MTRRSRPRRSDEQAGDDTLPGTGLGPQIEVTTDVNVIAGQPQRHRRPVAPRAHGRASDGADAEAGHHLRGGARGEVRRAGQVSPGAVRQPPAEEAGGSASAGIGQLLFCLNQAMTRDPAPWPGCGSWPDWRLQVPGAGRRSGRRRARTGTAGTREPRSAHPPSTSWAASWAGRSVPAHSLSTRLGLSNGLTLERLIDPEAVRDDLFATVLDRLIVRSPAPDQTD